MVESLFFFFDRKWGLQPRWVESVPEFFDPNKLHSPKEVDPEQDHNFLQEALTPQAGKCLKES